MKLENREEFWFPGYQTFFSPQIVGNKSFQIPWYLHLLHGMPQTSRIRENSVFVFIVVSNRRVFFFSIVRFHWFQSNLESRAMQRSHRMVHVPIDRGYSFERNCVLRRWESETLK